MAFENLLESAKKTAGGISYGIKNILGLQGVDLLPGVDVAKATFDIPASELYKASTGGYDPTQSQILADPVGVQRYQEGQVEGAQTTGGGGDLSADVLKSKFGFTDPNVINAILNSPEEAAKYLRELGLGTSEDERTRTDEQQAKVRGAINEAYAPIFASLDERIGLVGPQKEEFLAGVMDLVTPQKDVVEVERAKGIRGLEASKVEEGGIAKSAIRDLEEDVMNQFKSTGQFFGALGAGDSSFTGVASEAIGTAALKARGKIREGLQKAVNTLNLKAQDVNDLATTELSKIEQWKGTQIMQIKSFFMERLDNLQTAKTNAQGSRAAAIANMIQETESAYVKRLQQLDDSIYQFRSAIATWQMQRQGDLEDYATKLALSAKYEGGASSSKNYKKALDAFNKLNQTLGATQARQTIIQQYGIDPLGGVQLSPTEATGKARSPFEELERTLVSSLSQESAPRTGVNLPFGLNLSRQ